MNTLTVCADCGQTTNKPGLRTRKKNANDAFYRLGLSLWDSIPYLRIDTILQANGFKIPTYEHLECVGENTRVHVECGEGLWLTMSWYRHEKSGRYEVTAYVN